MARPVPRQLPLAARGFVGRDKHLAELNTLLSADSVVISALDGTAGIGKTTLAVTWAHQVQDEHFPDGTLHTNLRGYGPGDPATPAEVLDEFLLALGMPPDRIPAGTNAKSALFRSLLAGKRVLIVLDNANEVSQVRPLLPGSPGCLALITSRASLTGLVINDGAHRVTLDLLTLDEATTLVREILGSRATEAPEAVADLIRQCAHLPLALRIAAGRAATQPHLEIADLVTDMTTDRWDTLTVPGDEATAVRAVFDWSYRRLKSEQARVFRRLGLHPGPDMSLHAAAAVTDLTLAQARKVLDHLAEVHLIEPISRTRYRFHDLLRAYAADRTTVDDLPEEREAARRTVLEWYTHHAAMAAVVTRPHIADWHPALSTRRHVIPELAFNDSLDIQRWLDIERANLIACAHETHHCELYDLTTLVTYSIALPFGLLGYQDDMLQICGLGVDATRRSGDSIAEAHALDMHAEALNSSAQWSAAIDTGMELLVAARRLNEPYMESAAFNNIGLGYLGEGRHAEAEHAFNAALPSSVGAQRGRLEAVIESNLARLYTRTGDFERAINNGGRCLALRRRVNDRVGQKDVLHTIAAAHQGLEAHDRAIRHCQEALGIDGEYDTPTQTAEILRTLATSLFSLGHVAQAIESLLKALMIFTSFADPRADEVRQRLNGMPGFPSGPGL